MSEFSNLIKNALEDNNVDYARSLFEDNLHFEDVKCGCWDLVPILTKYLTSKYENDQLHLFRASEELLNKIAERSNPEEALLQFIEEIEESVDDTQFVSLLLPALKILQRIPKNRLNSISWYLNAIQTYLATSNPNERGDYNSELRIDLIYSDVIRLYELLLAYYKPNADENGELGTVLRKHLIELLGKPLGYSNLTVSNDSETKISKIVKFIVGKILSICPDPFTNLIEKRSDYVSPNNFSYGIFLYLILFEKVSHNLTPKIYNFAFIFYSSLNYIIELLEVSTSSVTEKGLNLTQIILEHDFKLSYLVLELDSNKKFCDILENVIVYNENENCRNQAFKIFKMYVDKFEVKGQYLLLSNLVCRIKHSGLAGFTITLYKTIMVQSKDQEDMKYFKLDKLNSFIRKCNSLPKEDKFSILNSADKIISVLNLMRFVVIREEVDTFSKSVINEWIQNYVNPLDILLKESKNAFREQKFELEQGTSVEKEDVSLSVSGEDFDLTKVDALKNVDLALTGIEMMESLLERLNELMEIKHFH